MTARPTVHALPDRSPTLAWRALRDGLTEPALLFPQAGPSLRQLEQRRISQSDLRGASHDERPVLVASAGRTSSAPQTTGLSADSLVAAPPGPVASWTGRWDFRREVSRALVLVTTVALLQAAAYTSAHSAFTPSAARNSSFAFA